MYFMAQKRVTADELRVAFLEIDDEAVSEDYQKTIHEHAYPIMWEMWKERPHVWVNAIASEVAKLHGEGADDDYKRPWDFAIFLINNPPGGKEVKATCLGSAFYFFH